MGSRAQNYVEREPGHNPFPVETDVMGCGAGKQAATVTPVSITDHGISFTKTFETKKEAKSRRHSALKREKSRKRNAGSLDSRTADDDKMAGLSTRVDHAAELDKSKGKFKSRADVPKIPRRTSLPDASENNENNMGIDSRPFGEFAKPGRRRTQ